MRTRRPPPATVQAARVLARAEEDDQRLRAGWLALAQAEPDNETGLAMLAADMDRAHAALQALIAVPPLPPAAVLAQMAGTAGTVGATPRRRSRATPKV